MPKRSSRRRAGIVLLGTVVAFAVATGLWSSPPPIPKPGVITDTVVSIAAGGAYSFELQPALYRVDTTSSPGGVVIAWVGTTCPTTREATTSVSECLLAAA